MNSEIVGRAQDPERETVLKRVAAHERSSMERTDPLIFRGSDDDMGKQFVVTRVGTERLRICYGDFRTECLGHDDSQLRRALAALGPGRPDARLVGALREAVDRFLVLERRSLEKFGKPKMFRIWRVDEKTLQIDFDGGYAELRGMAAGERTLKRCLTQLGVSDRLYPQFKKELQEFLNEESRG